MRCITWNPCFWRLITFWKRNQILFWTGGSSGIGKATGYELASRGARVILACRNEKLGDAVARKITKRTGNSDVRAMYLDLSSLHCIKDFVKKFQENENRLNILINNAGTQTDHSFMHFHLVDTFRCFWWHC